MPIVEVHLLEGYSTAEKSRLTRALTDAVRLVVPASDEAVTVMVHEMAAENYSRGGQSRSPAAALPDPKQLALDFLEALEARNLEAAEALLAPNFRMTFPGSKSMTTIGALINWAKDRYHFVKKTITSTEAFHSESCAKVYVSGTLSGEWLDDTPFKGIRFIDRFVVKHGKLISLNVWNDLAEEARK
ncbi:MAG: tautomerase family protein [Aestuariivita sp.]|nr:tautomerase family protein [Aestuariivita sp.]MCY4201743.1 tautomerase family protein [Aestuariivita sp.]